MSDQPAAELSTALAPDTEINVRDAFGLDMDLSTLKANLSVGMPLDLLVYEDGALELDEPLRIEADDPYYRQISSGWGDALRSAFDSLPDFSF